MRTLFLVGFLLSLGGQAVHADETDSNAQKTVRLQGEDAKTLSDILQKAGVPSSLYEGQGSSIRTWSAKTVSCRIGVQGGFPGPHGTPPKAVRNCSITYEQSGSTDTDN